MSSNRALPPCTGVFLPVQGVAQEVDFTALADVMALIGGWPERVSTEHGQGTLVVNEDGALLGLPVNDRATGIASILNESGDDFEKLVVIHGDVVLAGPVDDQGELLPLHPNVRKRVIALSKLA